jgi:hypothetical protein
LKKFYEEYETDSTVVPPLVALLPWTHNCILVGVASYEVKNVLPTEEEINRFVRNV